MVYKEACTLRIVGVIVVGCKRLFSDGFQERDRFLKTWYTEKRGEEEEEEKEEEEKEFVIYCPRRLCLFSASSFLWQLRSRPPKKTHQKKSLSNQIF